MKNYMDVKFDTEVLQIMLEKRILEPTGYDFSGIIISVHSKENSGIRNPYYNKR